MAGRIMGNGQRPPRGRGSVRGTYLVLLNLGVSSGSSSQQPLNGWAPVHIELKAPFRVDNRTLGGSAPQVTMSNPSLLSPVRSALMMGQEVEIVVMITWHGRLVA